MSKLLAAVAAILLFGCGSSEVPSTTDAPVDSGPPQGGVSRSLQPGTRVAKLVLRTVLVVDTVQYLMDPSTGAQYPAPCTAETVSQDCTRYWPEATCKGTVCTITRPTTPIASVKNVAVSAADFLWRDVLSAPCDDRTYVAEVYGAATDVAPFEISEIHVSSPFTMSRDCQASPEVTWSDVSAPTLEFPDPIQVGLGGPDDKYTVSVKGLAYPWSTYHWAVMQGTNAPLRQGGSVAIFAAPTRIGELGFTGEFHLSPSLLIGLETPASWVKVVTGTVMPVAPP